jgi:hypothetical protein
VVWKSDDEPGAERHDTETPGTGLGDTNKRFQNKLIPRHWTALISVRILFRLRQSQGGRWR